MRERREKPRHMLAPPLPVIHPDTGEELGLAIDISPEGMQMTGRENLFKIGQEDQVFLLLPRPMFTKQSIDFEARCIWTTPGKNGYPHCYGFQFTKISPDIVGIIVSLIYENE